MSGGTTPSPAAGEPGQDPDTSGGAGPAGGGIAGDDPGAESFGAVLGERMRRSVAGIEPRPGALEHLRWAVPARRRRRRGAAVGATVTVLAAAVLLTVAGRDVLTGGGDAPGRVLRAGGSGSVRPSSPGTGGSGPYGVGQSIVGHTPVPAYPFRSPATPAVPTGPSSGPGLASAAGPGPAADCQNSSMSAAVPAGRSQIAGVSYETVTVTAASACVLTGPPVLTVFDATGAESDRVPVFKGDSVLAPGLPAVPTWGRVLNLRPGDRFQFEFAWAPAACPPGGPVPGATSPATPEPTSADGGPGSGTPPATGATGEPTTPVPSQSSAPPAGTAYTVSYSVSGTRQLTGDAFTAPCGAAVYVTDVFRAGEYAPADGGAPTDPVPPS